MRKGMSLSIRRASNCGKGDGSAGEVKREVLHAAEVVDVKSFNHERFKYRWFSPRRKLVRALACEQRDLFSSRFQPSAKRFLLYAGTDGLTALN